MWVCRYNMRWGVSSSFRISLLHSHRLQKRRYWEAVFAHGVVITYWRAALSTVGVLIFLLLRIFWRAPFNISRRNFMKQERLCNNTWNSYKTSTESSAKGKIFMSEDSQLTLKVSPLSIGCSTTSLGSDLLLRMKRNDEISKLQPNTVFHAISVYKLIRTIQTALWVTWPIYLANTNCKCWTRGCQR